MNLEELHRQKLDAAIKRWSSGGYTPTSKTVSNTLALAVGDIDTLVAEIRRLQWDARQMDIIVKATVGRQSIAEETWFEALEWARANFAGHQNYAAPEWHEYLRKIDYERNLRGSAFTIGQEIVKEMMADNKTRHLNV
jgi:hypothetical protein